MAPKGRLGPLFDLVSGRARARQVTYVSHHFMSPDELATPLGRERLDTCVFEVALGDRLVSMCEVNGTGMRAEYYAALESPRPDAEPASVT